MFFKNNIEFLKILTKIPSNPKSFYTSRSHPNLSTLPSFYHIIVIISIHHKSMKFFSAPNCQIVVALTRAQMKLVEALIRFFVLLFKHEFLFYVIIQRKKTTNVDIHNEKIVCDVMLLCMIRTEYYCNSFLPFHFACHFQ